VKKLISMMGALAFMGLSARADEIDLTYRDDAEPRRKPKPQRYEALPHVRPAAKAKSRSLARMLKSKGRR
jgi:hypothetical protein